MHTSTMSELVLLSCGSLYSVYFRRILSMSVLAYWNNLLPELKIISAISQSHKILSSYAFFINPNLRLVNVTCIKWNNLNYMIVDDMAVQCFLSIWYSDLPTPKPCIWSVWKKLPKTWRLGPQTWRFPKYESNKTKKADYFCHGILYPISGLCCTVLSNFW